MQYVSKEIRNDLWDKLKVIFNRYVDPRTGELEPTSVEEIVREVLGEKSKMEVDYVMKNMFRLDLDSNGGVSLLQFGNFLFKRHCGQISLQKMHKSGKIKNSSERKIQLNQFFQLLDNAYAFLGASCQKDVTAKIFNEADKDRDGKITYVEYFQFIEKYVCLSQSQFSDYQSGKRVGEVTAEPQSEPQLQGKVWRSQLRSFLWTQLKKIYDLYVGERVLLMDDEVLGGLIFSILGDISEIQMNFLLSQLYKASRKNIQFLSFASVFLYIVAELGLSRFQKYHPSSKRSLRCEEFVLLFVNTYKFLSALRIKSSLLQLIYQRIKKNRDGYVSFEEYLKWVRKYIAVDTNRGEEYYLLEDDDELSHFNIFEQAIPSTKDIEPETRKSPLKLIVRFKFISYDLAEKVRQRVLELLIPYDRNRDKFLEKIEIENALIGILRENDKELLYVTRNVFRYDKDNDGKVTYSQFTDFCVEKHFGEMMIQRLHAQGKYSRGQERILNYQEFEFTIRQFLSSISLTANTSEIRPLFDVLDEKKEGWISYKYYFMFLKQYFGSLSPIVRSETNIPEKSADQVYLESLADLTALERFIRLMIDQLRQLFLQHDYNKNLKFEINEIQAILEFVFEFSESERDFILFTFFRMEARKDQSLAFEELVAILLQVYFVEILIKRRYQTNQTVEWKTRRISREEFILLITEGCFFIRLTPQRADLVIIFNMIDENKDGYISFQEYFNFIRKYLGNGYELPDVEENKSKKMNNMNSSRHGNVPSNVSNEEWEFIQLIWGELKQYFDIFDTGRKGYLTEDDLKKFVIEVLNETTQRELDYIFWNKFRIDPNGDKSIEFFEFAPFILDHSGEIALQKFHRQQVKGKSNLTEEQLYIVFSNAFSFLKSMPKEKKAVTHIYRRIGHGKEVKYNAYMGWIHQALAARFM